MGFQKTEQTGFPVYYARGGEILPARDTREGESAFVTSGALLGIKPIGSDAKHVVALDTDAVENRAYDHAGLRVFGQVL